MALTVFLRGANVGGRNVFRPAEVAAKLPRLRVTSIGAAGTFVVGAAMTAAEARRAFERALGFETHILVRPAAEILSLVAADPFRDHAIGSDVKAYVTVLERRPSPAPRTPLRMPDGAAWQVSVIAVRGVFALSLHRRAGRTLVYPNEAIEKRLGLAAT
ncbi:MAG: DUF1697 domain-containing protein, partial [Hyphomicrobiales bacterium]